MRQDMGHSAVGKLSQQTCIADEGLGILLGAPVRCQEPFIRLDDLRGHQPLEQAPDTIDDATRGYHCPTPQTRHRHPGVARHSAA